MSYLTVRRIAVETARTADLTVDDVLGISRHRRHVRVRHLAMWVARRVLGASLPHIGRQIGNRDHTTAHWAIRATERRLAKDPDLVELKDAVLARIEEIKAQAPPLGAAAVALPVTHAVRLVYQSGERVGSLVRRSGGRTRAAEPCPAAEPAPCAFYDGHDQREYVRRQDEAFAASMRRAYPGMSYPDVDAGTVDAGRAA